MKIHLKIIKKMCVLIEELNKNNICRYTKNY